MARLRTLLLPFRVAAGETVVEVVVGRALAGVWLVRAGVLGLAMAGLMAYTRSIEEPLTRPLVVGGVGATALVAGLACLFTVPVDEPERLREGRAR